MKRIVTLLMVLVMLLGSTAMTETATTEGEWHDRWLPPYEYSGKTKLPEYMNTDSYWPIVKDSEDITLTIGIVYNDTYTDPEHVEKCWFYTFLSKYTNIKFEFECIPKSALDQRKSLVFLEGKLPDLMIGYNLSEQEMVAYGDMDKQLLNIEPYLNNDLTPTVMRLFEKISYVKPTLTTPSGAIYTLPLMYEDLHSNGYGSSELMFVKTEWLNALGYEKAPNTLDGFTEMLYKMKEAYPDCIPLMASDGSMDFRSYILNALGYLTSTKNDTGFGPALRNGDVVIPCADDTFYEFLRIMNEYYINGLIPQDYFTLDEVTENALLSEANFGATNRASLGGINGDPAWFQQFWTGYPLTSKWNDKQQVARKSQIQAIGGVAVSADTEYPEVCVRLLDFWFTDLGCIYIHEGPAKGSPDTLGMTDGHSVTSDWIITYHDVANETYKSGSHYLANVTNPSGQVFGKRDGSYWRDDITVERMISIEMSGNEVTPRILREDNSDNWFKLAKIEGFFPYLVNGFPEYMFLDEVTSQKLADLESVIGPWVDSEVAKFITGQTPLDQFDEYQAKLKDMGIDEYLKIYQDFYANYLANK